MIVRTDSRIKSIEGLWGNTKLTKAETAANNEIEDTLEIFSKDFRKLKSKEAVSPDRTEDLIILYLLNRNPALKKIKEIINDESLELTSRYPELLTGVTFALGRFYTSLY